jgi:hypothetical protein
VCSEKTGLFYKTSRRKLVTGGGKRVGEFVLRTGEELMGGDYTNRALMLYMLYHTKLKNFSEYASLHFIAELFTGYKI